MSFTTIKRTKIYYKSKKNWQFHVFTKKKEKNLRKIHLKGQPVYIVNLSKVIIDRILSRNLHCKALLHFRSISKGVVSTNTHEELTGGKFNLKKISITRANHYANICSRTLLTFRGCSLWISTRKKMFCPGAKHFSKGGLAVGTSFFAPDPNNICYRLKRVCLVMIQHGCQTYRNRVEKRNASDKNT